MGDLAGHPNIPDPCNHIGSEDIDACDCSPYCGHPTHIPCCDDSESLCGLKSVEKELLANTINANTETSTLAGVLVALVIVFLVIIVVILTVVVLVFRQRKRKGYKSPKRMNSLVEDDFDDLQGQKVIEMQTPREN